MPVLVVPDDGDAETVVVGGVFTSELTDLPGKVVVNSFILFWNGVC
jgi:hypothetical protein